MREWRNQTKNPPRDLPASHKMMLLLLIIEGNSITTILLIIDKDLTNGTGKSRISFCKLKALNLYTTWNQKKFFFNWMKAVSLLSLTISPQTVSPEEQHDLVWTTWAPVLPSAFDSSSTSGRETLFSQPEHQRIPLRTISTSTSLLQVWWAKPQSTRASRGIHETSRASPKTST